MERVNGAPAAPWQAQIERQVIAMLVRRCFPWLGKDHRAGRASRPSKIFVRGARRSARKRNRPADNAFLGAGKRGADFPKPLYPELPVP